MNRLARTTLAILTLLAPLLLVIAVPLGYWYVSNMIDHRTQPHVLFRTATALCLFLWYGLLTFYMVHAWRSGVVPPERRRHWLVVLWAFNVFAMPVYWYRFIRQSGR